MTRTPAVISEMFKLTASLLNHALSSGFIHASMRRSPLIVMLGVNYRFSDIVLGEFAILAEGRPINAYGVLEVGDRAHLRCCTWGAENLP
ncbi:hypothetical protein P692DRAFT_20743642 [Suillus brevipes Sb2]|nr:hypothetical protein P692DRAFT_20743642 [Suillus brevipes Sb2]